MCFIIVTNYGFMLIFFYSFHSFIKEAIRCVVGRDRLVVVYKQKHGNTAYLPDQSAHARELFDILSTR